MKLAPWLLLIATPAFAAPLAPAQVAARLAGGALVGGQAFAIVQSLTDQVGQRLAGSPSADRAVEWAVAQMRALGLKNVRTEPVKVGRWVRGDESVSLLAPVARPLHATALGGSVGTPPAGIAAEVVEVGSFDELKAVGEKARGKIVLFNKVMQRTHNFEGYGGVVGLRGHGAVEAARVGAVAALVRSIGTGAYRLPHTGATRYDKAVPAIPFAALAAEDADQVHRLLAAGPVRVQLRLGAHQDGEVMSANVVGEVVGRDRPDEVVVIGAHLDSWDLGDGAIDDGAGCAIALETAHLLTARELVPRRTVRVVLFMNEENGLDGARAYADAHKAELPRHVAALEADAGAGAPRGFAFVGGPAGVAQLHKMVEPLAELHLDHVGSAEIGGADLIPLQNAGVPIAEVEQDEWNYFDWHHTAGDTLDKIDPHDLALEVTAFAFLTHALADSAERLPAPSPPPKW